MDSGNNSGSMQSSSGDGGGGDDQEYDSRHETISSFFNPSAAFASISNNHQHHRAPQPPLPPPPPPSLSHHHSQQHQTTYFDPSAQNLDPFSHSTHNPDAGNLYNLDLVWSRGLGPEPIYTELGGQSVLGGQGPSQGPFPNSSSSKVLTSAAGINGGGNTARDQTSAGVVKNSRKRTRASRRAPTTVLTTDTTNFRQMVQEFTGIPSAPFSGVAASPYSRGGRLDLFGPGSALNPFRPSANKVQSSPFLSSSSSNPPLLNSTMVNANNSTTNNPNPNATFMGSASNNFQLPSSMLNLQNPLLSYQALLQQPPLKHPLTENSSPVFGSKPRGNSAIPFPSIDENLNPELSGFPSQVGSNNSDQLSRWRNEEHLGGGGGSFERNNINGGGSSRNVGEFHPEKDLQFQKE